MVREHRSEEAVAVLVKSVALNPSDPWNYIGLANALNFSGRPREALEQLDAALRVDPDPGWMDYRHYQAGLAYFGEDRFDETVSALERIDMQSPDPWSKFYAVQLLVSANGHLGRSDRVALYMDQFRRQLAERKIEPPNQLLTQQFFVFKSEADITRLLDGLDKAGVPELPESVQLDPKDRLNGQQIRTLLFGHDIRGRQTAPEVKPYGLTLTSGGAVRGTLGSSSGEGTAWVQENFLCNASPKQLTNCSAIFRNPSGTPVQENEYKAVYRFDRFEFSVVR